MKTAFTPEQIVTLTQTLAHNPEALAQILGLAATPAAAPAAAAPATAPPPPPKPQPQPLPDNLDRVTRIPVIPGTRINASPRPALILAAVEGQTTGPKGPVVYPRAVCIHFGRSAHVSGIIGSRSSSTAYREDNSRKTIEDCDAWQLARTLQDQADFYAQQPDSDGAKQPAKHVPAEVWFRALAESILTVTAGTPHRTALERAMLGELLKDTVTITGPAPAAGPATAGPAAGSAAPTKKARARKA